MCVCVKVIVSVSVLMFQTLLHLPHRNINKGFDLYHLRRVVEQFGFCASFLRDFASSAFRVTVRGPSVTVALTPHSVVTVLGPRCPPVSSPTSPGDGQVSSTPTTRPTLTSLRRLTPSSTKMEQLSLLRFRAM